MLRSHDVAMVLLIVIAMLTLFSVIALSFVFYAEAEAVSAQATSASGSVPRASSITPAATARLRLGTQHQRGRVVGIALHLHFVQSDVLSQLRGHQCTALLHYRIPRGGGPRAQTSPQAAGALQSVDGTPDQQ